MAPSRSSRSLVKWLVGALIVAAAFPLVAVGLAWTGIYNVAASSGHWSITEWVLEFGMRQSVNRRALLVGTPPSLDGAELIRLGAGHFHSGCAFCHGAPGLPVSPIAGKMLPPPPDLRTAMGPWNDRELFWIVKHGIKYTGMPSWVAQEREDEIWAVVAFLRRLRTLDEPGYRDLALGAVRVEARTGRQLATSDLSTEAVSACARCHGAETQGPLSKLVPVLHGQSGEFLLSALQAYADGRRPSGIMQPMAADLSAEDMRRLADYYAALRPPAQQASATDAVIEAGRMLAENGAPEKDIPPCMTCHGREALASYPLLPGQNAAYMAGQLRLWKQGHNRLTEAAAVMAPIARRMSNEEIEAVSAYFAALALPARGSRRP